MFTVMAITVQLIWLKYLCIFSTCRADLLEDWALILGLYLLTFYSLNWLCRFDWNAWTQPIMHIFPWTSIWCCMTIQMKLKTGKDLQGPNWYADDWLYHYFDNSYYHNSWLKLLNHYHHHCHHHCHHHHHHFHYHHHRHHHCCNYLHYH